MKTVTINLRVRDMARYRLLLWALAELWSRMDRADDQFAPELERLLRRVVRDDET